jgi:hypothetical protein
VLECSSAPARELATRRGDSVRKVSHDAASACKCDRRHCRQPQLRVRCATLRPETAAELQIQLGWEQLLSNRPQARVHMLHAHASLRTPGSRAANSKVVQKSEFQLREILQPTVARWLVVKVATPGGGSARTGCARRQSDVVSGSE